MNDTEHKLDVLASIAERFHQAGIIWAVGASLLLYLKGKTDLFHDLDLMIAEADMDRAADLLSELGALQPPNPNAQYNTKVFQEYVIDGVDVDAMAGFVIVSGGQDYDCALREDQIAETVLVRGQPVPLQSLDLWKRYYALMGRTEKSRMLE